jgi:uncharacterized protein YcfL
MRTLSRKLTSIGVTLLFVSSLILVGCSSKPSEAELKQLQDLKDEVTRLEKDLKTQEQQAATLEQEVAAKNSMMKKCNDDQQIVKQRLVK